MGVVSGGEGQGFGWEWMKVPPIAAASVQSDSRFSMQGTPFFGLGYVMICILLSCFRIFSFLEG